VEVDVVEAPGGSGKDGRHTTLTLHDLETEVDGLFASIASSPTLSAHGVGAVSVCSHTLTIDPCLRNCIASLTLGEAEHLTYDSSRGNLDQNNVIKTDLVEGVLEGHATLNLVCLDHGFEDIPHGEDLAVAQVSAIAVGSADPVCNGQNGTQVITGVAPLGSEPAVIEIEPSDHGTNVEGTEDRVELVGCTRNSCAVRNCGSRNDRAEQLGAVGELEGLETTSQGVKEDISGSVDL
jgi:hypothetical protein